MSGKNKPEKAQNQPTTAYAPFRIDTTAPPVESERLALFYIDDAEYTGPAQVSGPTALKALQWLAERGPQYAAYQVMIECIGQDTYDTLTSCPQLTLEQVRDLVRQISSLYFGQALDALGE